jgi:hypothetical protein
VVYRALGPNNYDINELEKILAGIVPMYEKLYLFGDFNIDLLDPQGPLYETFVDLLNIFMLYNVSPRPTRNVSGKLLDLSLTTDASSVEGFHQHEVCWSDHDMNFMTIGTSITKTRPDKLNF